MDKKSEEEIIGSIHKTGDHDQSNSSSQLLDLSADIDGVITEESELTYYQIKELLIDDEAPPLVSIIGLQGMGKTFLAKQVYYHEQIRIHFKAFAWVPIKKDFRTKNVLRAIMLQLVPERRSWVLGMGEIKLAEELFNVQNKKKCLIVLEDVWTKEDWWIIRMAFPIGQSKSIILFTTTSTDAADEVKSLGGVLFHVNPLNPTECNRLLKEKANFDDQELVDIGYKIFMLSGGSPLAAITLGKSFKAVDGCEDKGLAVEQLKSSESIETTEMIPRVLSLIYGWLPLDLRWCLVYLGQFPEGKDIHFEKLELLWKIDNSISSSSQNWLEKLFQRNLIQVKQGTSLSKSCRLHHLTREMCVSKGKEEGWFEVEDFSNNERLSNDSTSKEPCRLALYLNKDQDGLGSKLMSKKVLSLLVFDAYESKQKKTWPPQIYEIKEYMSNLQILLFDEIDFAIRKFPKGMDKLHDLRYLSFQGCWLEMLPSSLSKLKNLETLDLGVRSDCKMTIPNVLKKMEKLKNLYFPLQYQCYEKEEKLDLSGFKLLEVLVNFNTEVCNVEHLPDSRCQTLTVISEGKVEDLEAITSYVSQKSNTLTYLALDIRNFIFYTSTRIAIFKKVVECKSLHFLQIEGLIGNNLPEDLFKSSTNSIEIMVCKGLELEKNAIPVLGKFRKLIILELVDDAFVGEEMRFSSHESDFPCLQILKLLNLRFLKSLTFEDGSMPQLSTLLITKCHRLNKKSVPPSLKQRIEEKLKGKEDDFFMPRRQVIKLN